jgi:long-chain acyl-CoA synthetase
MLPSSATPEPAHVGAPSINVEAKLVGVDDDVVEKGADPIGEILVRGPPVGSMLSAEGESGEKNAWVQTGEKGRVMTNGAFKVLGLM